MVTLIAGKKGSGKTKDIVKRANESLGVAKGNMIFIDDDNRAMYDLHHNIRFINLSEFPVKTSCEFLGFLCGLISNNYDIQKVYIDGVMNTVKMSQEELHDWFSKLESVSKTHEVDFTVTLNCNDKIPEPLLPYVQ